MRKIFVNFIIRKRFFFLSQDSSTNHKRKKLINWAISKFKVSILQRAFKKASCKLGEKICGTFDTDVHPGYIKNSNKRNTCKKTTQPKWGRHFTEEHLPMDDPYAQERCLVSLAMKLISRPSGTVSVKGPTKPSFTEEVQQPPCTAAVSARCQSLR